MIVLRWIRNTLLVVGPGFVMLVAADAAESRFQTVVISLFAILYAAIRYGALAVGHYGLQSELNNWLRYEHGGKDSTVYKITQSEIERFQTRAICESLGLFLVSIYAFFGIFAG